MEIFGYRAFRFACSHQHLDPLNRGVAWHRNVTFIIRSKQQTTFFFNLNDFSLAQQASSLQLPLILPAHLARHATWLWNIRIAKEITFNKYYRPKCCRSPFSIYFTQCLVASGFKRFILPPSPGHINILLIVLY